MLELLTGLTLTLTLLFTPALAEIGPDLRLNADTLLHSHAETCAATSLLNPNITVVGCNDDSGSSYNLRKVHYFRTTDGGLSWNSTLVANGPEGCTRGGDPSVCTDARGRFYAVYLTRPCLTGDSSRVVSQASTDGGVSWQPPVTVYGVIDSRGADKPYAVCDMSRSSPFVNSIYVTSRWRGIGCIFRSTDGGSTFEFTSWVGPAMAPCPAVGPDGTVYVVWESSMANWLTRSLDGGETWEDAQWVSSIGGGGVCVRVGFPCPSICADISNGPYRGRVYLCYMTMHEDFHGGVYVKYSDDRGETWSDSVRVSDTVNRYQWFAWLTVHPVTGDVAVSWVDSRDSQGSNCTFDTYGAMSTDGGATWAPNIRLSAANSNPRDTNEHLGDYSGLAPSSRGFLSAWPEFPNRDYDDLHASWWNDGSSFALAETDSGAYWGIETRQTVHWQCRYVADTLRVDLNRNYPSGDWESLGSVPCWADSLNALVPGPASQHCRVRLFDISSPERGDTTQSDFTIGPAVPMHLTAYRLGDDIRLMWQGAGAPHYRIYSAETCDGPFSTLEGSTMGNMFVDVGAANVTLKFYTVRASTEP